MTLSNDSVAVSRCAGLSNTAPAIAPFSATPPERRRLSTRPRGSFFAATAGLGGGQGIWDFRADAGIEKSLSFVIPADASTGAYGRTLTFTTAPPAA